MKIAILSDIHANRYALESVLEDSENQGVEEYWVLGDLVGYGPHPVPPLLFLKRYVRPDAWVIGNHDAMLADLVMPGDDEAGIKFRVRIKKGQGAEIATRGIFLSKHEWEATNTVPVEAIQLNRRSLAGHPEADAFWREAFVPDRATPRLVSAGEVTCVMVHASQFNPLSKYIYPWNHQIHLPAEMDAVERQLAHLAADLPRVQFYGHTHVPALICRRKGQITIETEKVSPGFSIRLEGSSTYLINPGSVGQPRDRDQRAAYVILDTATLTVTFRRVRYEQVLTLEDLMQGGYPDSLIRRLRDAPLTREVPPEWEMHYEKARYEQ